jgi:hypothetical protein
MSTAPGEQADQFRAVLAPTVAVLRELVEVVRTTSMRHSNLAGPESRGMMEIAIQAERYSDIAGWAEPLSDAHSFGAVTLLAAADYAETFARLFESGQPPAFGHFVVARAALEACVVSAWLNDPDVSIEERLRRTLCEHLYNSMELKRLAITENAVDDLKRWVTIAESLGLNTDIRGMKPAIGETRRPSMATGIDDLLSVEQRTNVGKAQWSYLSSISHVTWYGLRVSIGSESPEPGLLGSPMAHVFVRTQSVQLQAFCVLRALRAAGAAQCRLMGWEDETWATAASRAYEHSVWLLEAVEAALAAEERAAAAGR